ncbi:MAG: four-carbon acid sugar kinase family protein, partial [Candidatus Gastranaerophilales bacterium]|nr:four-carbon acid sugar kinase family protein [Candidatus Gastranaerophilales bacterium]
MLLKTGTIGIIADDLTGANDTALQFHLRGCNTQILFDYTCLPDNCTSTGAWAISTESRNIPAEDAYRKVFNVANALKNTYKAEFFYKKIDSTLRGNVAKETIAAIEALEYDAAVIVPAFPTEGR